MRPKRCSRISGAAWRTQLNVPFRCTPSTASNSSSFMLKIMRSRRNPAQVTRMSMRPNFSTALPMMRCRLVPVGNRVGVGDCLAAGLAISATTSNRRPAGRLTAVEADAVVVDDDLGALIGELERHAAADAAPGAGDHRDLAAQHFSHDRLLVNDGAPIKCSDRGKSKHAPSLKSLPPLAGEGQDRGLTSPVQSSPSATVRQTPSPCRAVSARRSAATEPAAPHRPVGDCSASPTAGRPG